jgi:hypothetical protein
LLNMSEESLEPLIILAIPLYFYLLSALLYWLWGKFKIIKKLIARC